MVEYYRKMSWHDTDGGVAGFLQQLPQHVAKSRNRTNWQAIGLARQWRQGVIGAENVGRAVDEIEMVALFHE